LTGKPVPVPLHKQQQSYLFNILTPKAAVRLRKHGDNALPQSEMSHWPTQRWLAWHEVRQDYDQQQLKVLWCFSCLWRNMPKLVKISHCPRHVDLLQTRRINSPHSYSHLPFWWSSVSVVAEVYAVLTSAVDKG